MIKEELIKIWQSSPRQERIKFEKSHLMIELQSSLNRLDKKIKYRDLIETAAAIVVVPIFLFTAYNVPHTLSRIASVLIAFWAIYVIFKLQKAKKNQPHRLSDSYLDYLRQMRLYLKDQKKLLDEVVYWYILPFMAFVLLFMIGFINLPDDWIHMVKPGILCVGVGILAFVLNKRAVKKTIVPRLKKIDELIEVLQE